MEELNVAKSTSKAIVSFAQTLTLYYSTVSSHAIGIVVAQDRDAQWLHRPERAPNMLWNAQQTASGRNSPKVSTHLSIATLPCFILLTQGTCAGRHSLV